MSEWAQFQLAVARGFRIPAGLDRCEQCGFHTPTQGHRDGCPTTEGEVS